MATIDTVLTARQAIEPDCFETPDVPTGPQVVEEDDSINEDIARDHLSPHHAFTKFRDSTLETTGVDFSDGVGRRLRTPGYMVTGSSIEMGAGREENVVSKYNRLKHEVAELLEQVEAMATQDKNNNSIVEDPATLSSQVQALHHQLQAVQLSSALGTDMTNQTTQSLMQQLESYKSTAIGSQKKEPITGDPKDGVTYELYYQPSVAAFVHLSQLADLERRVDSLEKVLGQGIGATLTTLSSELRVSRGAGTVLGVLGAIQTQLGLLDGRMVDALEKRLEKISQHHQQLDSGRTQSSAGIAGNDLRANENKINTLYAALSKHDTEVSLPDLVGRLRALRSIHEQVANFSGTLSLLESTQSELAKMLTGQESALEKLHNTIQSNTATIADNLATLASRLDALGR